MAGWVVCDGCRYPFWARGRGANVPRCRACGRKAAAVARAELRAVKAALARVHRTVPPAPYLPRVVRVLAEGGHD